MEKSEETPRSFLTKAELQGFLEEQVLPHIEELGKRIENVEVSIISLRNVLEARWKRD